MQSKAKTVDAYMQEVPEERRPALERIRALCLQHLEGFEETMAYGMPGYRRDGVVEVSWNSQKNYIALYILRKEVLDRHRASFARSNLGKGCIRFRNPDTIDYDLVTQLLADTAAGDGEICP
jgi:uncharacterized protein YdhG (YjbR/CyaY superfamily)